MNEERMQELLKVLQLNQHKLRYNKTPGIGESKLVSAHDVRDVMSKRFKFLDHDEVYYITDTSVLKSESKFQEEYLEKYKTEILEDEYTEDEVMEMADEAYQEYLYEHSMDGKEITDKLNLYMGIINFQSMHLENLKNQIHVLDYCDNALRKELKGVQKENKSLRVKLDYHKRMHERFKSECLAVLDKEDFERLMMEDKQYRKALELRLIKDGRY